MRSDRTKYICQVKNFLNDKIEIYDVLITLNIKKILVEKIASNYSRINRIGDGKAQKTPD